MLETPPGFVQPVWQTMANVTSWFDWEALSAIGTVGALWYAVVQGARSGRAERLRAEGVLTALIGLIEPICECVPEPDGAEDGFLSANDIKFLQLGQREAVRRAIAGLNVFSVGDIASVGVTEFVTALPLALEAIDKGWPLSTDARVSASSWSSDVRYICEAVADFRKRRDILRYGRLGSLLRQKRGLR